MDWFGDPLIGPTVVRIVGLLALGAAAVALVERKPWSQLRETVLFQRVFSWAIAAPPFVLAIFLGGPVGLLVIGYIVAQGLGEYCRLVGMQRRYAWVLLGYGLATIALTGFLDPYFLFAPLLFFVLVTVLPIVTGVTERVHQQMASSVFGYLYIPFPLAYLVYIREVHPDGVALLLLIGVAVALSDVLAFTTGSVLGGPPLAPAVSPAKTWTGALGNLLGAGVGLAVMWFAVPADWSLTTRVLFAPTVAAAALFGDLIESLVKRDFAAKDAGTLLPGFGGLLDRIDSLLLALPLTYYVVIVSQHFTA